MSAINYEDMALSVSQTGEEFWFSTISMRGDTLYFGGAGDYLIDTGLGCTLNATIRKDAGSFTVPLKLSGPLRAPCIDITGKTDSKKTCF